MKKKIIVAIFILALFGGSLFAQNVDNAQRVVGSWVDHTGNLWVFNANGTMTRSGSTYKYAFIDSRMALADEKVIYIYI